MGRSITRDRQRRSRGGVDAGQRISNNKAAILSRLKAKQDKQPALVNFHAAATEIDHDLNIPNEAATMLLYGLCATGNVRWVDDSGAVVGEHFHPRALGMIFNSRHWSSKRYPQYPHYPLIIY